MLQKTLSGTEFLRILGSKITDSKSILRSAYDCDVPVFCPALSDSMIGLQAWLHSQTKRLSVDAFADIKQIVDICYESPKAGIVIIGGGVPKNFALQSMLVTPNSFKLAIQLTTDTPENGGLSGATLSEAISWGKVSAEARYVTVYGDATITFPLYGSSYSYKAGDESEPRSDLKYSFSLILNSEEPKILYDIMWSQRTPRILVPLLIWLLIPA